MKKLWFAIQVKTSGGKYRAFATCVGENNNLKGLFESFETADRKTITANCWPKEKCLRIVDGWNAEFKKEGILLEL